MSRGSNIFIGTPHVTKSALILAAWAHAVEPLDARRRLDDVNVGTGGSYWFHNSGIFTTTMQRVCHMKFHIRLSRIIALSCLLTSSSMAVGQQLTPLKPTKPQPAKPAATPATTPAPTSIWGDEDPWAKSSSPAPSIIKTPASPAPAWDEATVSVQSAVPKTPEEISDYLRKMRKIIDRYDSTVANTLLGSGGIRSDASSISSGVSETQRLVSDINLTIPPAELKLTHARLASTLNEVNNFISRGAADPASLMAATSLCGKVHSTLEGYHSGVLQVMAKNNISAALDPFAGESQDMINKFAGGMEAFKNNKINELMGGGSGGNGGGAMPDLNSLFGGGGGGGATDPSSLLGE
jgi:hypothetical protein